MMPPIGGMNIKRGCFIAACLLKSKTTEIFRFWHLILPSGASIFAKSVILSVLSLSPTFNEMPFMSDNANIDEDIIVSVIKDYLLPLKEAIESLIEKY